METIGFIGQRYGTHSPIEMHEKLVDFFTAFLLPKRGSVKLLSATGAGVDLPMIEAAKNLDIPVELVVPFPDHTNRWPDLLRAKWEEVSEGLPTTVLANRYARGVYDVRNQYIVKRASAPLYVFWDGVGDDGFGRVLGMVAQPGSTHTITNLAGQWLER